MAITTCNLHGQEQRERVRDLLEKYDDEVSTIEQVRREIPSNDVFIECTLPRNNGKDDLRCMISINELCAVFEARKQSIEAHLSTLGISLKAQDDQPSASPRLDAAVRNMLGAGAGGTSADPLIITPQVTESVTPVYLQQPGCIDE